MMTQKTFGVILFVGFMVINLIPAKIYRRCELARELKIRHKAPMDQLPTWVCIAERGAQYSTRVLNVKGPDPLYGLFQINGKKWCGQRPRGKGCRVPCRLFRDNDLRNDFKCAQKIYNETKQRKGDGFLAWKVYERQCKGKTKKNFLKACPLVAFNSSY